MSNLKTLKCCGIECANCNLMFYFLSSMDLYPFFFLIKQIFIEYADQIYEISD